MAKKVAAAKKTSGSKNGKAEEHEEGMVTLSELAAEHKISPQRARQKLRGAKLARERGARWKWKEGSRDLAAARKALEAKEAAE